MVVGLDINAQSAGWDSLAQVERPREGRKRGGGGAIEYYWLFDRIIGSFDTGEGISAVPGRSMVSTGSLTTSSEADLEEAAGASSFTNPGTETVAPRVSRNGPLQMSERREGSGERT